MRESYSCLPSLASLMAFLALGVLCFARKSGLSSNITPEDALETSEHKCWWGVSRWGWGAGYSCACGKRRAGHDWYGGLIDSAAQCDSGLQARFCPPPYILLSSPAIKQVVRI